MLSHCERILIIDSATSLNREHLHTAHTDKSSEDCDDSFNFSSRFWIPFLNKLVHQISPFRTPRVPQGNPLSPTAT